MYALSKTLSTAKWRQESGLFMAQGPRCVFDLAQSMVPAAIYATEEYLCEHPVDGAVKVTSRDIQRASTLKSPQPVIGLFPIPHPVPYVYNPRELTIALDAVQDPGNLGTIVRIADWFGVKQVILGQGCVDPWSPKVVQASMGALGRVGIVQVNDLAGTLGSTGAPIAGTFLDGDNLYSAATDDCRLPILVMGNEGNGISPEVAAICTERWLIPSYPPGQQKVESLNVAMATGIIVAELRRRGSDN